MRINYNMNHIVSICIDFVLFSLFVCKLTVLHQCSSRRQNEDSTPLMPKQAIGDGPTGLTTEQSMYPSAPHKSCPNN